MDKMMFSAIVTSSYGSLDMHVQTILLKVGTCTLGNMKGTLSNDLHTNPVMLGDTRDTLFMR